MKKSFFIFVLIAGFTFGQNFFNHKEEDEEETNEIRFFDYDEEEIDYQFLLEAEDDLEDDNKADYDSYSDYNTSLFAPGGPPGYQSPIDDWIFLLPIAGMTVGIYFLRKRKCLKIKE